MAVHRMLLMLLDPSPNLPSLAAMLMRKIAAGLSSRERSVQVKVLLLRLLKPSFLSPMCFGRRH